MAECNCVVDWKSAQGLRLDNLLARRGLDGPDNPNATLLMSMDEGLALLDLLLQPTARVYIEWGSGGSTELVSWLIVSGQLPRRDFRAFSIESSTKWIATMHERSPLIRRAAEHGDLTFIHADIELRE